MALAPELGYGSVALAHERIGVPLALGNGRLGNHRGGGELTSQLCHGLARLGRASHPDEGLGEQPLALLAARPRRVQVPAPMLRAVLDLVELLLGLLEQLLGIVGAHPLEVDHIRQLLLTQPRHGKLAGAARADIGDSLLKLLGRHRLHLDRLVLQPHRTSRTRSLKL